VGGGLSIAMEIFLVKETGAGEDDDAVGLGDVQRGGTSVEPVESPSVAVSIALTWVVGMVQNFNGLVRMIFD